MTLQFMYSSLLFPFAELSSKANPQFYIEEEALHATSMHICTESTSASLHLKHLYCILKILSVSLLEKWALGVSVSIGEVRN